MGTWGTAPFANDSALDLLETLLPASSTERLTLVLRTLDTRAYDAGDDGDDADDDDAARRAPEAVISAAAVIAANLPTGAPLPWNSRVPGITRWLARPVPADTPARALAAIDAAVPDDGPWWAAWLDDADRERAGATLDQLRAALRGAELACRICGLVQHQPPWGADGTTPSFGLCERCGVQFGYPDATAEGVRRYRAGWLDSLVGELAHRAVEFERTFAQRHGVPPGRHLVTRAGRDAATATEEVERRLTAAGAPAALLELYRRVAEISLPDLGDGVFVRPAADVADGIDAGRLPTELTGDFRDGVVAFGAEGADALLAVSTSSGAVYRLVDADDADDEAGGDGDEEEAVQVVADNLWGFLDDLRARFARFG
ncbi:DUF4259 domain-containing protein [Streptomyces sp. B6B3]|uniref:DUF4259 domain-containing protein n=1 Tax=Streptomyces sp. B6B3 TaxID=3153570 RepID=UPI00325E85EE